MANKLKILVDAHVFDHSFQGSGTYLQGLYNEFVKIKEIEITICAFNIENAQKYFPDSRFKFHKLKTKSKFIRLAYEYPKIIKAGNYEYAHFNYIAPFVQSKLILTIHDVLFLDFKSHFSYSYRLIKRFLYKFSAKRADIILSVSEYSKQTISTFFKIEAEKIHITPLAVSIPKNKTINIKTAHGLRDYILFVSRFEPRKNQIGLLKVYLELELYNKYDLVFIGSKHERIEMSAYQKLVNLIPSAVKNKIRFFEGISHDELNGFYAEASCSVYPSFAEGFGIPPLEAAVNNCKVLCSNKTALADFDFFKYVFDPNNIEAFKSKLISILNDNEYPYESIKNEILDRYNWQSIAKTYYAIINNNQFNLFKINKTFNHD